MDRRIPAAALLFALLAPAHAALAQTGPDLLLKPFREEDQFELNSDVVIGLGSESSNNDPATGDAYDNRVEQYRSNGRLRLTLGTSTEGLARAQPRAGFDVNLFQIESDDPALPDELLDASAAFGMGVADFSGWLAGVTLGAGYAASDSTDDANALYLQANFAVGKTFENGVDSFGVVVNFDGNRTFLPDWPLPGFQYRRRLSDEFILAAGFPFSSLEWRPTERFTATFTYSIPQDLSVRADYDLVGGLGLYGSFNRNIAAFHWDELDAGNDRVFFERFLGELGFAYDLDEDKLRLILAGGYAFGQEFNTGFDTRDLDELAELDDSSYVRAAFELRL